MKAQGLIKEPKPLISASLSGILTALVVVTAFAAGGYFFGRSQPLSQSASGAFPQFALLVKADDIPPADGSQPFKEYSAWVRNLKKERWADGEALHGKAWRLHRSAAGGAVETLPHELKTSPDELSGYFLFEAATAEEALKIASTCPHLNYSGTLELREIYK